MNYKKVIEDFQSGVLDKERFQLIMENDGGYWRCIDDSLGEEKREYLQDLLAEKYGEPEGYRDIVDVLIAAGVNCEWC